MFQKKAFLLGVFLTLLLMLPTGAFADNEIQLSKTFSSIAPVFMSGHDGDPNWIEGFTGSGDIYLGEEKAGTVTFTATLMNPPLSYTDRYQYVQMKVINTLTGMGSFEVNCIAIALLNSNFSTNYNATISWTGSISNGTGSLSSLVGLSAGTIQTNLGKLIATAEELILYRLGY
jgi:hypothetical protein